MREYGTCKPLAQHERDIRQITRRHVLTKIAALVIIGVVFAGLFWLPQHARSVPEALASQVDAREPTLAPSPQALPAVTDRQRKPERGEEKLPVTPPARKSAEPLIPRPTYDARPLFAQVLKDIQAHPLLERESLDVRVLKVENGYVTLTALSKDPYLAYRLENPPESAVETVFSHYGPPYQALVSLRTAIEKNPACKGVFWKELPVMRAQRLFADAVTELGQDISRLPSTGDSLPSTGDSRGELLTPRETSLIVYGLTQLPRAKWAVLTEEALQLFPGLSERWEDVRRNLRAGRIEKAHEAAMLLLVEYRKLLNKESGTLLAQVYSDSDICCFPKFMYKIKWGIISSHPRSRALSKMAESRRVGVLVGKGRRRERELLMCLVVQERKPDGRISGWIYMGDELGQLWEWVFLPIEGTWDIARKTMRIVKRADVPFDELYRQEDAHLDIHLELTANERGLYQDETRSTFFEYLPGVN